MTDPTSRDLDALTAEPDDLDGHTIEELADYLDAGRTPPDPTIESSPACLRAIAALERLRFVAGEFLTDDSEPVSDVAWVDRIMQHISSDARAGADVLLESTPDGHQILTTEGALRALVRAAGDSRPGVLVGRARLTADFTDPSSPATVEVDIVVAYGVVIPDAVRAVRDEIAERLRAHTHLQQIRVDVTVRDLLTEETR